MMKGLLLKDLYISRSNILVTVVSLIVLGLGISFLMESSALLLLTPAVTTTAVFISITADANSKWNKNVITMVLYGTLGLGVSFLAGSISLLCAYLFDLEKSQTVFMLAYVISLLLFMLSFVLAAKMYKKRDIG